MQLNPDAAFDSDAASDSDAAPSTVRDVAATVPDEILAYAVEVAQAALLEDVGDAAHVGEHVGYDGEETTSGFALTHRFAATLPGYRGWHWAVTIARAEDSTDITVCESVLLPGDGAITVPDWLPWSQRVRAEDLGPGDIMQSDPDDDRLAPAYLLSDDPEVEEVAFELGLGRARVMSREGRLDTADRWSNGPFGSGAAMAKHAPAHCGSCGFYLPLAGSLRAAFGACGNQMSPADGSVVIVDFGCGAHSEATVSSEPTAPIEKSAIYDTADFDVVDAPRHIVAEPDAAADDAGLIVASDPGAPAEPTVPDVPSDPDVPSPEPSVPNVPSPTEPTGPDSPSPAEPTVPDVPSPAEPTVPDVPSPAEPTVPDVPSPAEPTVPDVPSPAEPTVPDVPSPGEPATPPGGPLMAAAAESDPPVTAAP